MTAFQQMIESALAREITFHMSRMNYGEVLYSIRKGIPTDHIDSAKAAFLQIPIQFHSIVDEAAALKAFNTFSYADAFAAALALRMDIPLATGDREFLPLREIGLRLLWMRA